MCLEEEEVFCWLLVSVYRVAEEYWHIYIYYVYIYYMCIYIYDGTLGRILDINGRSGTLEGCDCPQYQGTR